jgi:hypothetical protein
MPCPAPKKAGEYDGIPPDPSVKETLKTMRFDRRDTEAEYAYLPATPENVKGLADLMDRMQDVRARMAAFLRQDNISASLASLAASPAALPAPL